MDLFKVILPLAQFDKKDEIKGYFYPSKNLFQDTKGYSFYLGDDSGLGSLLYR